MRLFGLFSIALLLFALSSCEKETTLAPAELNEGDVMEQTLLASLESLTTADFFFVSPSDEPGAIQISLERDLRDWAVGFGIEEKAGHDCEGSGISFVRCVKKLVDAGSTVAVGSDGNGGYYTDVVD